MLHLIVSENQGAFVPTRQLSDCALLVNELCFYLKRKKIPDVMLKLDFEKAYDTISHHFLLQTMKAIGFWSTVYKLDKNVYHGSQILSYF